MDEPLQADQTGLDDVAYLARSANRVAALGRLAGAPATRRELHADTGISQPTLTRILEGFEARDWVVCDRTNGRVYELTPFGEVLARGFGDLLAITDTMQTLGDLADHLPLSAMDFDLRRFAEATITVPRRTDAMAHIRREDELIEGADRVRFLCSNAFAPGIKAYRDRLVASDQSFEAVIAADALDVAAADPQTAGWVQDIVGSDNATIYRYEGPVSLMLGRIDEVTSLVPLDNSGVPVAFIETHDPVIRAWAEDYLDDHRARAEPVTAASFQSAGSTS